MRSRFPSPRSPVVLLRAVFIVVLHAALISTARAEPQLSEEVVRAIYSSQCSDCHESDGRGAEYRNGGSVIPDFSSEVWMQGRSATQLKLSILLGKGEEMPPFEGEISEAETVALVRFIRAMAGLAPVGRASSNLEFDHELAQLNREWERLRTQWNQVFAEFETALVRSPRRSPAASYRDVK